MMKKTTVSYVGDGEKDREIPFKKDVKEMEEYMKKYYPEEFKSAKTIVINTEKGYRIEVVY